MPKSVSKKVKSAKKTASPGAADVVWLYGRRDNDVLPGVVVREDGKFYIKAAHLANIDRQLSKLSMLMDSSRSIMAEIDLDSLLQLIMQKVTIVMNADRSSLFLVDDVREEMWTRVAQGAPEIRVPLGHGIAGHVGKTGQTENIADAYSDARFNRDFDLKTGYRTKTILCMAIKNTRSKIIGTIQVLNKKDETPFTKDDEELLSAFCSLAGISLENARAYEELQKERDLLEIKVQERTRDLETEKKKADDLLLNILPHAVADELKSRGGATPRHFDSVTVMFTDFKGFTQIAEHITPAELIRELDACFYYFDEIMDRYQVEKIKTIGDSYMCAGGLPLENRSHPLDVLLAALEIRSFMQQMKEIKQAVQQPYWELRIGIHTGPVVAGVVGKRKFAYDIWGDAVNTASRMESSGSVGAINISGDTYDRVKEYFDCEYRGKVAAKNKGEIDMYFVKGLNAAYASAADPKVPNEKMLSLLKSLRG